MKFLGTHSDLHLFLKNFVPEFDSLPQEQQSVFETLLLGKLVNDSPSVAQIQRNVVGGLNQTQFYANLHILSTKSQLYRQIISALQNIPVFKMDSHGYLLWDEHVVQHSGKKIVGISSCHSTTTTLPVSAHALQYAFYVGSRTKYPLYFDIFEKNPKTAGNAVGQKSLTKNEMFQKYLQSFMLDPNHATTTVFDAFFYVNVTVQLLNHHKMAFVSRPKRNRRVTYRKKHYSITQLYDTLQNSDFTLVTVQNPNTKKRTSYYVATVDVFMKSIGNQRLVFIDADRLPKTDAGPEHSEVFESPSKRKFRVFVTNQFTWDAVKILQTYMIRWSIETHFRDESQNLGLHVCPWKELADQRFFFAITGLAYCFLQWWQHTHRYTHNLSPNLTIGEIKDEFEVECQWLLIDYIEHLRSCPETMKEAPIIEKCIRKIKPHAILDAAMQIV